MGLPSVAKPNTGPSIESPDAQVGNGQVILPQSRREVMDR